jgi:site-specific DNA recombinase
MKTLRCAIYTRKSSEEGLEQGFNSLHAQREACSAYILSQTGEGWSELPTAYDDGGFSGGSMERPGLKALMNDISKGLIDVVVVYKVDRLTRSLADFARIVELFDQKGVSFVSVTQAFNTTSSMGRLTLNVLLSFAQFEREVTGERIRDKIAASKQKGLWLGGRPPLGYDGVDRKLVVNAAEAETVRDIYRRYLELGCVRKLADDLKARGIGSKRWVGRKGHTVGGGTLERGALYHLLSNPTYRGAIRHKDKIYPDAHPAIIDEALWEAVQARLGQNRPDRSEAPKKTHADCLLRGRLEDGRGVSMTTSFVLRKGRQYRYYVAQDVNRGAAKERPRTSRMAVGVIDAFVMRETTRRLKPDHLADATPADRVDAALIGVRLSDEVVELRLRREAADLHPIQEAEPGIIDGEAAIFRLPIVLKHRQGATMIDAPNTTTPATRPDRALIRAVALAKASADQLAKGEFASVKTLAAAKGYCEHYLAKLLPLAWLAPDLIELILAGRQPAAISLKVLVDEPLPMAWSEQRRLFQRLGLAVH